MHEYIFLFNISNHSNIHHIPVLYVGVLRETGRGWVRYYGMQGIVWGLVGVLGG